MKKFLFLALVAFVASSCSDDDKKSNFALGIKGSKATLKSTVASDIKVNSFTFVANEVEFELDSDPTNPGFVPDEVEYKGPFIVNLVENGVLQTLTLPATTLPIGPVEEVEFELENDPTLAATHPMANKAIMIKGTYKGAEFTLFESILPGKDQEIEIEYETPEDKVVLTDAVTVLDIQMNIDKIVADIAATLDFATLDLTKPIEVKNLAAIIEKNSSLNKR